jgi:hypothetical protein
MTKRFLTGFAPLFAVAAFAVAPAVAQATPPQWYSNGKLILPGEVVPVETSGTLTFKVGKTTIKCSIVDFETVENPVGGPGTDQMLRFSLVKCFSKIPPCPTGAQAEIVAEHIPWFTRLIAGPPIRDEIGNMLFSVRCGGLVIDTYHGTLFPEVGNSVLKFNAFSGTLLNSGGMVVKVTGLDKLKGPPGDQKITAA